ncbi:MAG: UvrD-helicase domain-containing protein [Pseudomonadota bacterium]
MTYKPVYDVNQIDLLQHGLIEASAGTGKTYTIENLVVRLLREQDDVELENILIVTFTEKAASELKIRIREKLEGELDDPGHHPETLKKLRVSLDEFDRASIHTIHGFCQTILRDFAFENRTPFQSEVINDAPLYEALLKEQMRKRWPEIYGGGLKEILELSQFSEKKGLFLNTIISLAKSLHEPAGDSLLPDLGGRDFTAIKEEIASACMGVKAVIGSDRVFSRGFGQLNFNAAARRNILEKVVVPVEDYFSGVEADTLDLHALSALMAQVQDVRSSGRKGLDCLIPEKWNKGGPNLQACPKLEAVKQKMEEVNSRLKDLQYCLVVEAVHRLQDDVTLTKQNHGWISYYDMLALVETSLSDDVASDLLKKLRSRFRVAFIDEFQDTDPVQWRIFKKIFIDTPDEAQNRLFVIGDPKQAIYSFRGADVYAYLSAKNEMERLERRGKARRYSLSINWRSQPRLILAFNKLFCRDTWFKPQAAAGRFEIGYQETGFPDKGDGPAKMIADHSDRPVLNIVDLSESPSPKPAKLRLARFVAREIRHLTGCDIRIREMGKEERRIGFGDISILVRGRSDVPFLEDELTRENIPYAFYKKPGLFASDEAVYTSLVFHAILDPGDSSAVKKGLLTPFFGRRLQDLYAYEEMPPSHPVKQILFKWNGYALSRRWGYLFQSLMEDSGLLSREAGEIGWDRRYANYRQIFEYLEEVAYRKNLDFRGLSAMLDLHRNESWEAEEGVDIHQIETEARKVQIMTMHVSKGLQFPVVFVAGGLTQPGSHQDAYHTYHRIREGETSPEIMRIIDLEKSGGGGRHEIEKTDEDKRLYYVAATRAQFKLYLPFYIYRKNASWLGPVCTLLSPALMDAFPGDGEDRDVLWLTSDHHAGVSTGLARPETTDRKGMIPGADAFEGLFIPEAYDQRRIRVDSFSSLHQEKVLAYDVPAGEISFQPEQKGKENDEAFAALETGAVSDEGDPDEIPGGTDVGLMFHGILEHMDYGVVLRSYPGDNGSSTSIMEDRGTREIILGQMEAYRVDARWKDAVSRIIWNTLTTPVPPFHDGFTLARLKREDRLHEVEFYYSFPPPSARPGPVPGRECPHRFIRGFVDLIFRKGRKYYVADWKSNYLETGYDPESMTKSMDGSDYHLQYKLYAIAALRWLRQSLGGRFDPENDWGGVFYFYLRGMGAGRGEGIYHVPPDRLGSLDQLEEEIAPILEMGRR